MLNLIEKRWSPRAFSDKPVEPEKLRELFEAARWAASCFNEQPWRFVFAHKNRPEDFARLFECLVDKNKLWVKDAPFLMLSIACTTFKHNGQTNRHAWHDVGLALGNFTLQAMSLGLYVHQMAGFSPDKACENLQLEEGYEPVAMIAVGYPGDPARLPEELRQYELAERKRRPLEATVFEGVWGRPAGLLST